MIDIIDDLPDPEGPTIPTASPAASVKSTPRKISTGPAALSSVSVIPRRVTRSLPARWAVAGSVIMTVPLSCLGATMKTQVSRRRVQTSQYLLIFRGFKRLTAIIAFTLTLGLSHTAIAGTVIAVLGDSLAAGFGLATNEGFPARLEAALRNAGEDVRVINAGVSGDTSAGGLARLDWVLGDQPDIVLVELGSNDALRGLDPEETFDNLDSIVLNLRAREVTVILAGMMAPRNLGREYVDAFDAIYRRVAEKHRIALYPFFLDGVALNPALNQADLIHPNQAGVDIIVKKILHAMRAVLQDHRGAN